MTGTFSTLAARPARVATRGRRSSWFASFAAPVVVLFGCAAPPRLTLLTNEDYNFIADELAAHLQRDITTGPLAERSPESPAMVIAIQRVVNLTSDLLPAAVKHYLMERVKDGLPKALLNGKNMGFVISAELAEAGLQSGEFEAGSFAERAPTHVMTARFRSVTRIAEKERTESYLCDYQIVDLTGWQLVWSGQVEFKRWAHGRLGD
jgi:hypothetical protein